MCLINVHLGLLMLSFCGRWVVLVLVLCKVILVSNPTAVLGLCCRWDCDNILKSKLKLQVGPKYGNLSNKKVRGAIKECLNHHYEEYLKG